MLVLTRELGEELVFVLPDGREVTVKVCRINANGVQVRLGVTADDDIAIHRSEVWEQICQLKDGGRTEPLTAGEPSPI